MAVYEVFAHPELRRYKTTIVSKASLVMAAVLILTFIPPLFIVYRSYGFWLKEATYREMPSVAFKYELIVILELGGTVVADGDYVTYSTFQMYNQLQAQRLRVPIIKSREEDVNGDGKADRLIFNLEMPLADTENVMGLKLLLFFSYKLVKFSSFKMESLGYIEHESGRPGAKLQVYGDLKFQQKQPLAHKGIDTRFNYPVVNTSSTYADDYDLSTIFRNYTLRNVTTAIPNPYKIWTSGRGAGDPFVISATIEYLEETYLYTTGFWYLIKWGWVQYVAVLAIFFYIFERVKVFIFQNQLVRTIVARSADLKNKLT